MGYLLLAGAIVSEVVATVSLRASEGFTKLPFVGPIVVGYGAAFVLLSLALQRGIPLGVAYAIWSAFGVATVAVLSVPLFHERLSALQGLGLALVILGVVALELGTAR